MANNPYVPPLTLCTVVCMFFSSIPVYSLFGVAPNRLLQTVESYLSVVRGCWRPQSLHIVPVFEGIWRVLEDLKGAAPRKIVACSQNELRCRGLGI